MTLKYLYCIRNIFKISFLKFVMYDWLQLFISQKTCQTCNKRFIDGLNLQPWTPAITTNIWNNPANNTNWGNILHKVCLNICFSFLNTILPQILCNKNKKCKIVNNRLFIPHVVGSREINHFIVFAFALLSLYG